MKRISAFTAFLLLISNLSFASVGAVSTATGGSGRGAVESVDGILMNPAFIRDLLNRNFAFNYAPDAWALTVSDNAPDSLFPAALQMVSTKDTNINTQKLGLTVAAPRLKTVVFGATAAMVSYDFNPNMNTAEKFHQAVLDLGLTWAISNDIGFGIVAKNASASEVALAKNLQLQRTIAAGASYKIGRAHV